MPAWICQYFAETTAPDGTRRVLSGTYDGRGGVVAQLEAALRKRIRKRHLWLGVEVIAWTPLGQKVRRIIETDGLVSAFGKK